MSHQKIRIGFRGFGRIGRHIFRLLWGHPAVDITDIWVPEEKAAERALRLMNDQYYGQWGLHQVLHGENFLSIDGTHIALHAEKGLDVFSDRSWDVLIECSGTLKSVGLAAIECRERLDYKPRQRQKVIFTHPTAVADVTIVMGVNEKTYHTDARTISNASCTTNCAAPILKVLMEEGLPLAECAGLTVHAATGSQEALEIIDQIMDYTTGAAKILEMVLPELEGRVHMSAVRVPTAEVSYLQLICMFEKHIGVDDIRSVFQRAAEGSMKGVIGLSPVELSKTDTSGFYRKKPCSAIVNLRRISGTKEGNVRVIPAWYDNEYGYSCRIRDLLFYIAEREGWLADHDEGAIDDYIPKPDHQVER